MTDLFTIFIIAVGLAMDCFAVSLGIGTSGQATTRRPVFRLAWHMGLFQGVMTLLGWLAGAGLASLIAQFDHWVALAVLAFIGGRMVYAGLHPDKESFQSDPSRGGTLVMISVATSIDAMAVGLSMGMLHLPVLWASLVIGIVSLVLSLVGLFFGARLGVKFGKRMEVIGGLILVGIGLRIFITHVFV